MPTIAQLPAAATVGSNDELPISQGGVTNSVTVSELLASTQPQLILPTGSLLGRVSLGAGGPEPVAVSTGVEVSQGAIQANGTDHVGFPLHNALSQGDTVVINSGGAPALIPAGVLQGLPPALPLATATIPGAVLPGDGLAISTDGMLNVAYGTTSDTAAVGNDERILGSLQSSNNLAELSNLVAARSNLGLGTMAEQNASGVAITGGSIGAADVSVASALASGSTNTRELAVRFSDFVNINDFGLARDGLHDDSVGVTAAVARAAAIGGRLYVPAGGPILLGGAAQITLSGVSIVGDAVPDVGYPYGRIGSQFWINDTQSTPFMIGSGGVTLEGITFFYPAQIDQPVAPVVYPPLFTSAAGVDTIGILNFSRIQVTNAFVFLQLPATVSMNVVQMEGCRICAVDTVFDLALDPNVFYISNTEFSYSPYTDEYNHYAGGGASAQTISSVSVTADAPAGSMQILLSNVSGVLSGQSVSGMPGLPAGATVTSITGNSINLSMPTTADIPASSILSITQNNFFLRTYTQREGTWLRVRGGNSSTVANSAINFGGIVASNCYVFGFRTGIHVDGGLLSLGQFTNVGFDQVGTILWCDNGGTIGDFRMSDFVAFGMEGDAFKEPDPLFFVDNPPAGGGGCLLTVSGMQLGSAAGTVFDIRGDNVLAVNLTGNKLTNYGDTTLAGTQSAVRLFAPNARLSFVSNECVTLGSGNFGLCLGAVGSALVTGNSFVNCAVPVDVEIAGGHVLVSGNQSTGTSGSAALASGQFKGVDLALAGSVSVGTALTVTVGGLNGGASPLAVSYTTLAGDTLADAAMGLYAGLRALLTTVSVDVAQAAPAGALTLSLYSTTGLNVGMNLSGSPALSGNTVISAISGNTITLSIGVLGTILPNTSLSASGVLATAGVVACVVQSTASLWLFMPLDTTLTWASNVAAGSTITMTQTALAPNGGVSLHDTGNDWDKIGFSWNPLQFRNSPSAVNGVEIGGGSTGNGVLVSATGGDTNVQLYLASQGSDPVSVLTRQVLEQCRIDDFAGATNYAYVRGGTVSQPPLFSSGGSTQAGVALSGAGSGQTLLGSSGAAGSAVVWQGAQVDKSYVLVFPQSGQTLNVPNNCSLFQIGGGPGLAFNGLTVVMPTDPVDGQRVVVAVEGSASGLVFAANPGQVIDPPTTLGPGNSAEWWWNQQYTVWFRLR